ncbi:hypothetical protein F5Y19DRAFT_440801 [Xylariaceae sp. FL1651]|nr:hypothetical protein F5Y19DRAFT_440801 [Xylariaceae sp. FL1651]
MSVPPEVVAAITSKKAKYGRYADLKQWDKFEAEVALPDCKMAYLGHDGAPLQIGKTRFVFDRAVDMTAFFAKFFAPMQTLHNIGPGDFEASPTGQADEVRAIFGFEDQILMPPLGLWVNIRGGGYYTETWKEVNGSWFLKDLVMQRTYQQESFLVTIVLALQNLTGISFL